MKEQEPEPSITSRVVGISEIREFVTEQAERDSLPFMLFGGDRLVCCDEAVVLKKGNTIIGVATIAPYGEEVSVTEINMRKKMEELGLDGLSLGPAPTVGQPTIVGAYVAKEDRRKGYGTRLVEATIKRCEERGFTKIRVDGVTPEGIALIGSLSEETRGKLDIHGKV